MENFIFYAVFSAEFYDLSILSSKSNREWPKK